MSIQTNDVIEAELSFQLMSVLFKVHSSLGNKLQEKYYQKAIELELHKRNIPFEREREVLIQYNGTPIGKYRIDFYINERIVLEVKAIPLLLRKEHQQIISYIDQLNCKLGILANFRTSKLTYERYVL